MHIVHVAAEMAPIAKVGGLGDVVHGLSRALLSQKQAVTVILPKYDCLNLNYVEHLEIVNPTFPITFDGKVRRNAIWKGSVDGVSVIFIEAQEAEEYFDRGGIYGYADDVARFSYFSLAALTYLSSLNVDVLHIHDWHTALLAPLAQQLDLSNRPKVVLTIHNLAYQGICRGEDLLKIGLKATKDKEVNCLKEGILAADHVTTVSPNYAREILTTELGLNLQQTLRTHQHKFSGILNGIDYSTWNPETDPFLPTHFSASHPQKKALVKQELKKRLMLSSDEAPLVCSITRLVTQKGPELIKAALLRTLERGGQFVLLGSVLDEASHAQFYQLKRSLAGSRFVHLELTYNEELSHLVFAGADLFLVPSLFEPCGLTQMIAMRYGAVPLVRETGGLVDTVEQGKNGFSFGPPTAEAIWDSLDHALTVWKDKPAEWQMLVKNGMEENFSWERPAKAYLQLYLKTLKNQPSPFFSSR